MRLANLFFRRSLLRNRTYSFRSRKLMVEELEPRWCPAYPSPAVPAFSSLPGANHTIYLDFNGHVTQNTVWNSYFNNALVESPPYDTDGNFASFSSTELAAIEDAWKRVSEDFIPFNVNVTTVDPGVEALRKSGSGDSQWGVRVLITDDTENTGAGGIAYIDSFNWDSDTPVFVYVTGGKNIAEAASHEVGHSLGLSHDGTTSSSYYTGHGSGDTGWAPLMGVGYYKNVTQWDRGEYYGSNNGGSNANYGKGPNDLAVITTYNGFGYRPDDHGNTLGTASALGVSGTSVSGSGIITTTSDVDFFTFTTGAGTATLNVSPFTPGPNLDVRADLYNAAGTLIATSNPTATLSASFSLSLAAGQYYLRIDGTGVGTPGANPPSGYSDYASLGRYTISGTIVDGGQLPTLSINDVTVNETAATATFTVTVTGMLDEPVTVQFSTANGSATAGTDFFSAAGTLTFQPGGATTQAVTVQLQDDTLVEGTENFFVNLSNAAGAAISDGQGQATILDNETSISVSNYGSNEGDLTKGKNGGNPTFKSFQFTVSLSNPVSHTVTVSWATQDGTATTANNDYQAAGGTVTFNPGETSKLISVTVVGDNTQEPDETFSVVLSNPSGGSIADGTGTGTIVDDDNGNRPPKISKTVPHIDALWYFVEPADPGAHLVHDHHDHHDHGDGPHLFPLPGADADFDHHHELPSAEPGPALQPADFSAFPLAGRKDSSALDSSLALAFGDSEAGPLDQPFQDSGPGSSPGAAPEDRVEAGEPALAGWDPTSERLAAWLDAFFLSCGSDSAESPLRTHLDEEVVDEVFAGGLAWLDEV